jgi:hypothetical protein
MTVKAETVSIKHGGAVSAVLGFDLTGPPMRAMALGAVLACLVALALPELLTGGSRETMAVHDGSTGQLVKSMPPSLVPAVSESVGASERRFWSVRRGAALLTAGGDVRSTFNASGVVMRVGQGTLGLALAGVGRGGRFDPVAAVAPRGSANRILYRHGWISEFYRNGPFGLEQGFVVRHRPLAHGGSLAILLRVRGSLMPERVGAQVLFRAPGRAVAVSYGRLSAVDATGRRLPVSMWVGNGTLQLRVGDRNARYPLRIDPFIQQGAKLTGGGEAGSGEFGSSVALSADGNTALVGAPGDSGGAGAAWVFTRSGSTWTQQGEKLTGAGETGVARFGGSVALSADGDTALIGGARDAEGVGAAWVFTRSASTWAQQGEKLTGAGESGPGAFGQSVALSSDGSTALIGAPMDNPIALAAVGAAWVFTHSGATWTQQGDKLTGAGEIGPARFGSSVAVSADGNTAMIGGPNNQWCIGAAWILVRSGGVWNQQALLRGEVEGTACDDGPDDGESDELLFGTAVALSADGNVGLVSRPFIDALRLGETWSYARVGSSWTEKTALRDRKGAKAGASSVAVSADGQQVLLGKGEIEGRDSALAFVRAGSEWAQEGWGLLASDRAGFSAFGESVALTSSASTALIGGWADNGNVGAAWVFSKQVLPLPTAVTGVASSVTDASAALNGTVNPNGQEVFNCHFEYGTTTSYGSDTPCSALPGAGEGPVEASAPAQGLTANTTYHFRLVAANGGGVAYGADETLTTLPGPPAVVTGAASSITRTAATLNASVNPLGETVSDCHFEYGVSASYGSSVPCSQLPGSGSGAVEVSAPVGSLGEYHPYHFRIVATNPIGTSYGADRTFNTLSNAPEYGRCLEVTPHTGLYANNGCTKWGSGMRYEWHPGAVGVHFTVKLIAGAAAFETVKRSLITCTSETGSGEYTGQKTLGGILLTFAGCEQLGQKCTSLLAAEGELVTNPLEGVLGVIRLGLTSASNKIGLELFPAGKAGAFMEFTCGLTTVTLRGAVIVPVVANKMLTATTLKYSASRGKQHPERFLGEPAAILEASFGNKAYEQTGLTLEATQTSGAPVETNSVA